MTAYLAKTSTNNFDLPDQPEDLKVLMGIENRFFVCEASSAPKADFVIEMPKEHFENMYLFVHGNGKKMKYDITGGRIPFEYNSETDRIYYRYTPELILARVALLRWIAIEGYLADYQRLRNLSSEIVDKIKNDIAQISDDNEVKQFIADNLYYDL